jgi:hypothetical protein
LIFFTHKQTANPLRKCKIAGTKITKDFVKKFQPLKINLPIKCSAEDLSLVPKRTIRTANLLKVVTTSKDFLDLSCVISSMLLDHPATNNSHAFSLLSFSNPDQDKKAGHLSGEKISAAIIESYTKSKNLPV